MRLKGYQVGELAGIAFLLASTAAQIFYVEPLKREIEWRLAAFNMQQNAQVQTKAIYDSRIAMLQAISAPAQAVTDAENEREATLQQYKNADANIADFLVEKERVENMLQIVVLTLFAVGTLLAGFGRAMEMRAAHSK